MKKVYFLSLLIFAVVVASGQEKFVAKEIWGTEADAVWTGAEHIWLKQENTVPAFIQFRDGLEPDEETFFFLLRKAFHLPPSYNFNLLNDEFDQIGWQHKRFQITVNDIPVTNGIFILHLKNGLVKKFNGYLFKNVLAATSATVSESSALQFALTDIGAQKYKWQLPEEESYLKIETGDVNATYFPKGNLEILQLGKNDAPDFKLAWKFDIYAHEPMSRNYVYVDALTGTVLKKTNRIHNANTNGTATTVYRGNRTITADSYNGQYRLKEVPRGLGIHTYNMQTGTSYGNSVEFLDANNVWNNVNANLDQFAGDAHWGGEMTYDFYTTMGRNSIDGSGYALNLYMHYNTNYVNAFWDGTRMTFGDGNGTYDPLVSLDITGHEISHGLTERTSNLDYQDESGALNESFSDIFGTAVEWFADSTVGNWLIGEDIGAAFRSMSNPNSYGDPDTYQGTNWYTGTGDNGGVHTNSSVQNHWYYRLSQGGTGTNDIGNAYNVTGITRSKATKIAWRNDVYYLTSTADYADARFYAIQSATDLYGACSQEVISTTNAWYAVGVGAAFVYGADAQFTASPVSGCSVPFTVNFTNASINSSSYIWSFGDGGTSTVLNPSYTYNTTGTYTVKLVSTGACGTDSLVRTNYINVSTNNPCVVIMPTTGSYQTQTACSGTIYDNGGSSANYTNNANSTVTIAPTGASQVTLHFTQFNMEANYDYLYVYDGPTIASPVIGSYTGTTIPADVTSSGSSITIRQYTDPGVVASGFAIQWTCVNPTSPPVANFKADVTQSCSGEIQFTDLSTNGPNAWLWNFGDGTTSVVQHPAHNYINSGTYTVSLKATNAFGNNTITKTSYVTVSKPAGPSATNQSSCGANSFTFTLSDVNPMTWFDSAGNVVANTNPFVTPVLNTSTTYFVQDTQIQPIYNVGPTTNAIGTGSNYNTTQSRALRFRVFKKSKLVSVYVYAVGDGYRTVQYRDSLGGVIANKTVFIPNGESRIYLNLDLIPGGPYELGLRDTMNLYRNSSGAVYPYNDPNGIVSIIGNNAANSAAYYYFFYDWEVKENDCISQRTQVVATINPAISVTTSSTNVSCFGGNNGSASVSITNGTPGFTYQWSNNTSASAVTNLTAGTYFVTATDAAGCSATTSKTITQPTAVSVSVSAVNSVCGQSNGSVAATASGGIAGYSYLWSTGQTTSVVSNTVAGTYTVTVSDNNNCTATATGVVASTGSLSASASSVDVSCFGEADGSVSISIVNGIQPFSYSWSNGANTAAVSNVTAGTYNVTVTDNSGCVATVSQIVSEPAQLNLTTSSTNALCNIANGSASVSVSGGTQGYNYLWSNSTTGSSISNVTSGSYSVTVTDAHNCSVSTQIFVNNTSGVTVSLNGIDVTCYGLANGIATAVVTGGTQPFSYLWSNGEVSDSIQNLAAGVYSVTITDGSGCESTASLFVSQPDNLNVQVQVVNPLCSGENNGYASVIVTGGTPGYNYIWCNGSTTASAQNLSAGVCVVTVTDQHNCTTVNTVHISQPNAIQFATSTSNANFGISDGSVIVSNISGGVSPYTFAWNNGDTTQSLLGVEAGTYSITVTDKNGCTQSATVVVQENPTGIADASDEILFTIYPNPATAEVIIETQLQNEIMLTLKNVLGQNLVTKNLSSGKTTLDVSRFTAGVYLIELSNMEKKTAKQIIISR